MKNIFDILCVFFTIFTGESDFYALLDIWFPDKKPLPTAFLVDTSEEALLLPDWLKLRMIRSEVARLVDAGTTSPTLLKQTWLIDYILFSTFNHCTCFPQLCRTWSLSSCCCLFSPSAFLCPAWVNCCSTWIRLFPMTQIHLSRTSWTSVRVSCRYSVLKVLSFAVNLSDLSDFVFPLQQTTWPTWLRCNTSEAPLGGTLSIHYWAPLFLLTEVSDFIF